jgi:hypothetical protein
MHPGSARQQNARPSKAEAEQVRRDAANWARGVSTLQGPGSSEPARVANPLRGRLRNQPLRSCAWCAEPRVSRLACRPSSPRPALRQNPGPNSRATRSCDCISRSRVHGSIPAAAKVTTVTGSSVRVQEGTCRKRSSRVGLGHVASISARFADGGSAGSPPSQPASS